MPFVVARPQRRGDTHIDGWFDRLMDRALSVGASHASVRRVAVTLVTMTAAVSMVPALVTALVTAWAGAHVERAAPGCG